MVDQDETHMLAEGGEFLAEVQKLGEIISDIEKQKSYRIFGYLLIPIILGFFVLKNINENIFILTKRRDELTYKVINEIETSNQQLKNNLKHLKDADTFLIYSVRADLLGKLEDLRNSLHCLKLKNEKFEKYFNDLIETSINEVMSYKITIENFNKELIERRKKEYEFLLKHLKDADTFLIYSVRADLLSKLEDFRNTLHHLKSKNEKFEKYFNDFIETSINEVIAFKITIDNFNKELVERRKKEYEFLFNKSTVGLNDEQKTAIITDDKHNLVVAGAGSGKTEVLITRIAYLALRKQETVAPNRILALAFQNKAAKEIEERLNKRFGIEVKIKTFHSLGLEVLTNASLNPKLKFNGDNFESGYNEFMAELYKKAENEPSFQNKLLDYMLYFGDNEQIKQESDFEKKDEWYQYMQNLVYTALNGTKVKSEGERTILNFLFTHKINGKYIKVLYENPAEWMNYKNEKGELKTPKPDFFLPEYNIYIEHWAINERGNVPEWFDKDYRKGMNAKIDGFKQQKKYSLIETTYGEFKSNNFIGHFENKVIKEIRRKYPDQDFVFTEMGYSEIVERVWKNCKESMKRNPKDIANFITKAKTNGLTPEKILERLKNEIWSPKQKTFAELALVIYKEYEKQLRLTNEIDFSDMINLAIVELEKNGSLYENSFDHILIDEYQDISPQRYRLINALMEKNRNCKLFCVGDDWQSIMGFTGSNLEFFVKFQDYFDHPARTDLSVNYRSIKSIVDAGAELIKYNDDGQLKKQTIANNNDEKKILVFSSLIENKWNYYQQVACHCVNTVREYINKGYAPEDIRILYRIGNPYLETKIFEYAKFNNILIQKNSPNPRSIKLMTVHKSKGLQAKVVFLLCVDKGLYGFPCEIEDPFIFEPAMYKRLNNKEEEERRLFYVAITRSKEDIIIYTQKDNESMFLNEIKKYTEIKNITNS
ncbi:MAG: UvrD-helicase domain-containing protein [Candidatus Methanoperedens sp.]|nr:UvrD-helicase domain-containing protein [Candidatus Methanoperedens sp.]